MTHYTRLDQDPFDLVAAMEVALDIHSSKHTPQSKRLRDDELFWVESRTYLDHVTGSGSIYCGSDRGVLSIRTRGVGMSNPESCSGAQCPQEQKGQADRYGYREIMSDFHFSSFDRYVVNSLISPN